MTMASRTAWADWATRIAHPTAVEQPPAGQVPEPAFARLLVADTRLAPLWLLLRVVAGYAWLQSGYAKLADPAGAWVGDRAGDAVRDLAAGALAADAGSVGRGGWYAGLLREVVLPHAAAAAYVVTVGEILAGIALIVGLCTGLAAFAGGVLSASPLLAGALAPHPLLLVAAAGLVLAWRVAGYYGLDRWALPLLGVPGEPGALFRRVAPGGTGRADGGRHARAASGERSEGGAR
jgi:thiosulfate dehydrogenase [quinone] large subunit